METILGHVKDWTGSPDEVYIGRAGHGFDGYFGNPVKRSEKCPICEGLHNNIRYILICFETYARERIRTDKEFKARVKGLYGKKLMCFCWPKKACHGSVYIKLSRELNLGMKTLF